MSELIDQAPAPMKTGPLFAANYASKAPVVINQGGTSSGKTIAILQAIMALLMEHPGWECEVLGQDRPNLKKGPVKEALIIIEGTPHLKAALQSYNKSDLLLTFKNKSTISFASYDDAQDAKQGKPNILFANEANGVSWEIFYQRYFRTKHKTFIDYNPDSPFWVHEILLRDQPTFQAELLISDHRHNPFLNDEQRRKIEAIKETDIGLWRVYARGLTGKLQGLVFNNWNAIQLEKYDLDEKTGMPKGAKFVAYGMDFGYTNDPTALVGVWLFGDELLVKELIYLRGMNADDICQAMEELGIDKRDEIFADGQDPRLIADIKRIGKFNIKEADKSGDSIRNGIDLLKRYKIRLMPGTGNIQKELRAYKWLTDKNGTPLNKPVDFMNHAIDALRYAVMTRLKKPRNNENVSSRFS